MVRWIFFHIRSNLLDLCGVGFLYAPLHQCSFHHIPPFSVDFSQRLLFPLPLPAAFFSFPPLTRSRLDIRRACACPFKTPRAPLPPRRLISRIIDLRFTWHTLYPSTFAIPFPPLLFRLTTKTSLLPPSLRSIFRRT